ncbi:MAG: helix-turn-helix transcriptional regulator [Firmicutes bacterium]|nr:helix-turn-helix transcriptional regulator [Bacillota bacterium]
MDNDIRLTNESVDMLLQHLLERDDEAWREVLKQQFLLDTMIGLYKSRQAAGLTQEQVAKIMNTSQSAVARWEKDFEGKITLHRLADFSLACGAVPKIVFEPDAMAKHGLFENLSEYAGLNSTASSTVIMWPPTEEVSPNNFTSAEGTSDSSLAS